VSVAEALKAARAAGIELRPDGDDLVLEASAPPPDGILDLLSRYKPDILALLRPDRNGWSVEDWRVFFDERAGIAEFDGDLPRSEAEAYAFECCVIEWLNRRSCPSTATRCAQCGKPGSTSAVVLPFGTEPGLHVWLHAECWAAWQQARRGQAVKALALMGINPPVPSTPGRGHKNSRTTP
jgi:hypothetical protein